jgi:hypothetical protein
MWFFNFVFFLLVWASHGIFDVLTQGGYGAVWHALEAQ